MSPLVLGLLLGAAVLHASWNLLLKQAAQPELVSWWAMLLGSLMLLPSLLLSAEMPGFIWTYVLESAVFEAAYLMLLTTAYRLGDFSLVYPIARGTAPILLVIWSGLFLGEYPTSQGMLGVVIVVAGLLVVGSKPGASSATRPLPSLVAVAAAGCVALCISLYSIIDGVAVRLVEPTPYIALVFALTTLLMTPLMIKRAGVTALVEPLRHDWRRLTLMSGLMVLSYLCVVTAYARAPIGYAGAIREISIVFAALGGRYWLGESFGRTRLVGAVLMFGGIVTIAAAS